MPWVRLPPITQKELDTEKRGRGKKARFLIDKNVDRVVVGVPRQLHWNNRSVLMRAIGRLLMIVGRDRELWTGTKAEIGQDGTWTVRTFEQDTGRVELRRYRFSRGKFEAWEYVRKT